MGYRGFRVSTLKGKKKSGSTSKEKGWLYWKFIYKLNYLKDNTSVDNRINFRTTPNFIRQY